MNRITASNYLSTINGKFADAVSNSSEYNGAFTYDANGNILTLTRNGKNGAIAMDDLSYKYDYYNGDPSLGLSTNKLMHVKDNILTTASVYTDDIDDQDQPGNAYDPTNPSTWNYSYDEIGNLVCDKQEGIETIEWTVYGKIKSIKRVLGFNRNGVYPDELEFAYDANGNRVIKTVKPRPGGILSTEDQWTSTYYVRDAQGNVMATYERHYTHGSGNNYTDFFDLKELDIYGSNRLGIISNLTPSTGSAFTASIDPQTNKFINRTYETTTIGVMPCLLEGICPQYYSRKLGSKIYELTDHLGNVQVTVSDKKLVQTTNEFNDVNDFSSCGSMDPIGHSGAYSDKLVSPTNEFSCTYDKPVQAGDVITASVWAKYTDNNASRGLLVVDLLDANSNHVVYLSQTQYFTVGFSNSSQNNWYQYTYNYTVPAGITTPGLHIVVYAWNTTPDPVYVDDLEIHITHNGSINYKYYAGKSRETAPT